ncbi:hypothetical protein CDAR_445331 [Caerostris darwini]|uniref:Uncharacterized protein n=1 Tax=Caerostris darwini TaxID=1538125 RepID=A0AAV4SDV0_9ARAC|nr:hypothetical protein CDAR_445331 [Caerostris darwini]
MGFGMFICFHPASGASKFRCTTNFADRGSRQRMVRIHQRETPFIMDLRAECIFLIPHEKRRRRRGWITAANMRRLTGWIDLKLVLLLVFATAISEVASDCCHSYYPVYYPVHVGGG